MNRQENHNNHLSIKQIDRYLGGDLSNEEMYNIEYHVHECSICAEALEGYQEHGALDKASLDQLGNRFVSNIHSHKTRQVNVLKIAAVLALLITATIVVLNLPFNEAEQTLGASEETSEMPKQDSLQDNHFVGALADSINKDENPDTIQQPSLATITETEKPVDNKPKDEPDTDTDTNEPETEQEEVAELEVIAIDKTEQEGISGLGPKEDVTKEITDDEVVKDGFALDSTTLTAAPVARTETIETKKRSKSKMAVTQDLAQTRQAEAIDWVIFQIEDTGGQSATPADGLDAYKDYLISNQQYPSEDLNLQVSGYSMIEFQVDESGALLELTIIDSLSEACDNELLRLIKEGPNWEPAFENGEHVLSAVRISLYFTPPISR